MSQFHNQFYKMHNRPSYIRYSKEQIGRSTIWGPHEYCLHSMPWKQGFCMLFLFVCLFLWSESTGFYLRSLSAPSPSLLFSICLKYCWTWLFLQCLLPLILCTHRESSFTLLALIANCILQMIKNQNMHLIFLPNTKTPTWQETHQICDASSMYKCFPSQQIIKLLPSTQTSNLTWVFSFSFKYLTFLFLQSPSGPKINHLSPVLLECSVYLPLLFISLNKFSQFN